MTDQPDEPDAATEETEQPQRKAVRVPTGVDAFGPHAWMDCDPEAAPGWDARRWERLA